MTTPSNELPPQPKAETISLDRRRALLKGAGKAVPVVAATFAASAVQAQAVVCVRPSGFVSLNTFKSRWGNGNLPPGYCVNTGPSFLSGLGVGQWPNVTVGGKSISLAKATFGEVFGTTNTAYSAYNGIAVRDLITGSSNVAATDYVRYIIAAYYNAAANGSWVLSPTEVVALHNTSLNGTQGWTEQTKLDYLKTLMAP